MEKIESNGAKLNSTIDAQAARLFREKGAGNVSVIEVMSSVGMTHGGFYKHYRSKAELAASACKAAFLQCENGRHAWKETMPTGTSKISHYADQYLSEKHRDDAGTGCPIVGFLNDACRMANRESLKAEYANGVQQFILEINCLLNKNDDEISQYKSHALVAMFVGALSISRATQETELSKEILESVKRFVKEQNF